MENSNLKPVIETAAGAILAGARARVDAVRLDIERSVASLKAHTASLESDFDGLPDSDKQSDDGVDFARFNAKLAAFTSDLEDLSFEMPETAVLL